MKWRILTAVAALVFLFPGLSVSEEGRFTVNGDGTVTDNETGLMWQRCSAGLSGSDCSVGSLEAKNWESALVYCEDLVLPSGGYSDWRLPDIKELRSIVDNTRFGPAVDPLAFPGTGYGNAYESASTCANVTSQMWYIWFADGWIFPNLKTQAGYVRCVR